MNKLYLQKQHFFGHKILINERTFYLFGSSLSVFVNVYTMCVCVWFV